MIIKRFILIFFEAFLFTSLFGVHNIDSLFVEANNKYENNEYDSAIVFYEAITESGYESAELLYNLGNSYYKIRQYPKAILNYERALILDPGNEDVLFNLSKSKVFNVDEIEQIPEFIIQRWINNFVSLISSNIWAVISLSSFVLMLILQLIFFFTTRISFKRSAFYISVILILVSGSTFYFSSRSKKLQVKNNGCIVMSPTVTVKSSPSATGTDVFIIHEGTKAFILDQLGMWYEIELADGKQGWLIKTDVEPI